MKQNEKVTRGYGYSERCVSFSTAKSFAEAGFNEATEWAYTNDSIFSHIPAPTIYQAARWLREKYNLHILVDCGYCKEWRFVIYEIGGFCVDDGMDGFRSYEAALSAGLDKALEVIKNKKATS